MNRTERAKSSTTSTASTPHARRPRREAARDRALALLLDGQSVPAIADEIGCGRTTVWAWTRDPDFAAELAEHRARALALAESRLADATVKAVETLIEVMGQVYAGPASRVRIAACEAVLRVTYSRAPTPAPADLSPLAVPVIDPERERVLAELMAEKLARRSARMVETAE